MFVILFSKLDLLEYRDRLMKHLQDDDGKIQVETARQKLTMIFEMSFLDIFRSFAEIKYIPTQLISKQQEAQFQKLIKELVDEQIKLV